MLLILINTILDRIQLSFFIFLFLSLKHNQTVSVYFLFCLELTLFDKIVCLASIRSSLFYDRHNNYERILTPSKGRCVFLKNNEHIYFYACGLPKNVPAQNGTNGTSTKGAHTFMNQLGKNGVIRKNII